jgi:hypothetical protein
MESVFLWAGLVFVAIVLLVLLRDDWLFITPPRTSAHALRPPIPKAQQTRPVCKGCCYAGCFMLCWYLWPRRWWGG